MRSLLDIAVYDHDDQLVLVIEVKSKLGSDREWAGRLRRNILAHGVYPNPPFFLIAFPDRFYLWTSSSAKPHQLEPDYTVDARSLLDPYFQRAGIDENHIGPQSFELMVRLWISEVIHSQKSSEDFARSEQWLLESGLYKSIAGGRIEHEVPA